MEQKQQETLQKETLVTWIEVDLDAVRNNFRQVKNLAGNIKVLAVVKGNAYGHGLVPVSKALADEGADYLGVTNLDEAMAIRSAGIGIPILGFAPPIYSNIETYIENNITMTVCDDGITKEISRIAKEKGVTPKVHLKVDTGMGRFGILPQYVSGAVHLIRSLHNLELEGIYTHFSTAFSKDKTFSHVQLARFTQSLVPLQEESFKIPIRHCANSAAVLEFPESYMDMVRVGTILYGQYPSSFVSRSLDLKDTWKLKTRIVSIKKLPKGWNVGYGATFTTARETVIGVIPVGYVDGFGTEPVSLFTGIRGLKRILGGLIKKSGMGVRVHGKRVPVLGRISGQTACIDLTDVPDVKIGDEVTVPARRTMVSDDIQRVYI